MNNHEEISKRVNIINDTILKYQDDARKINAREALFEKDQSDYNKLNQITKEFLPYSNLWLTANKWLKNKNIWLECKWQELDAVSCEKFIDEGFRTLN